MSADKELPRFDVFLMEHYKQHWEHYRHLEQQRNTMFNAFLIVSGAAFGFYAQSFGLDLAAPGADFRLAILLCVAYQVVAFVFYGAFKRLSEVMQGYAKRSETLQKVMYEAAPIELELDQLYRRRSLFAHVIGLFGLYGFDKSVRFLVCLFAAAPFALSAVIVRQQTETAALSPWWWAACAPFAPLVLLYVIDVVFARGE